MKKVFVVSKTHLDLGYTDFASNVKELYLNHYINNAVDAANEINDSSKKFVWTTGSWILKEGLNYIQGDKKQQLIQAIKDGYVAPHAMPYTTHTELLDADLLEYGLNIVDELDELSGRKTVACKMTDVPGHSIAIVPYLAKKGFKLLHIGVNGASKLPNVPECFLWKFGEDEIIVIYNGQYGGAYESEYIDDILYFSHTLDNKGSGDANQITESFNEIAKKYPEHEVVAGTMDDYCELLYKVKDQLPVITQEIGDTWIHGVGSDPLKVGVYKLLCELKTKWLENGELTKDSTEYKDFADALMCIAEHTWGLDSKRFLKDCDFYLTDDFKTNRAICKAGIVQQPFDDITRLDYETMQRSWNEQRLYLGKAITALSTKHHDEAIEKIKQYQDFSDLSVSNNYNFDELVFGDYSIRLNQKGGITSLKYKSQELFCQNDSSPVTYKLYGNKDFEFFKNNYMRDLDQVISWATPAFLRNNLEKVDSEIVQGNFDYIAKNIEYIVSQDKLEIKVQLQSENLPIKSITIKNIYLIYTLNKDGLAIELRYPQKDAIRLVESLHFNLFPKLDSIKFTKLGKQIDPYDIIENGNRSLSCVDNVICENQNFKTVIVNKHTPLVSIGMSKILQFDNKFNDAKTSGISYTIFNNIWGTNFPLWIEGGFKTEFDVKVIV